MVAPNEDGMKDENKPRSNKGNGGFSADELAALLGKAEAREKGSDGPSKANPFGLDRRSKAQLMDHLSRVAHYFISACEEVKEIDMLCEEAERSQKRTECILGMDRNSLRSLGAVALTIAHKCMCAVDPVVCRHRDIPTSYDQD